MGALFGGLKVSGKVIKLLCGDGTLSHCKPDAELGGSDVARAQSIEIAEELRNANPLLLAQYADASNYIINVIRSVAHNLSLAFERLSLWKVFLAVIKALANSKQLLGTVDVLAEVNVVDLINIAFVHVTSEDEIQNSLWGKDTKLGQHTKELALGDMATLGDIEVLELRL